LLQIILAEDKQLVAEMEAEMFVDWSRSVVAVR
jgi:hypothetical protein